MVVIYWELMHSCDGATVGLSFTAPMDPDFLVLPELRAELSLCSLRCKAHDWTARKQYDCHQRGAAQGLQPDGSDVLAAIGLDIDNGIVSTPI